MKLKVNDYYLDIEKVFSLGTEQSSVILDLYRRMLDETNMEGNTSVSGTSIFNTLIKSGYIKNKSIEERDEKLGDLING